MNQTNHPHGELITRALGRGPHPPQRIAVLVARKWPSSGVGLTVGFLDAPPKALRRKILQHMNAWGTRANVKFTEAATDPQVRIAREPDGYWSYLGTDILSIPRDQQTMTLEAFSLETSDSEFHRVVRHETGHTLGFPHEHMRRELVQKIDEAKAIAYFGQTQGWTADEVRAQVLTPIEEASLLGTAHADPRSIMCYQIPGSLTKDGKPILGGKDIDAKDYAFAASLYPKAVARAGASAPRPRRRKAA